MKKEKLNNKMDDYIKVVEDVDIIEELDKRGIKGKQSGNNYMTSCPYHQDKHPSFGIRIVSEIEYGKLKPKGLFNCLGCGERGNFLNLISFLDDIPFEDAIKLFKKDDIDISVIKNMKSFFVTSLRKKKVTKEKIKVINPKFLKHFKYPYGDYLGYLHRRKLSHESIKKWNVMCCDKNIKGLKWKDRVVIPVCDLKERLIGVDARHIYDDSKLVKMRKIKNTDVGKVLFGLLYIKKGTKLVIVEGSFDAMYLQQYNVPAIAIGTLYLTSYQKRLIFKFTDRVVLSLDGDIPYIRKDIKEEKLMSVRKLRRELSKYIKVEVVQLPKNKDPNSLDRMEVTTFYKDYMGGIK